MSGKFHPRKNGQWGKKWKIFLCEMLTQSDSFEACKNEKNYFLSAGRGIEFFSTLLLYSHI